MWRRILACAQGFAITLYGQQIEQTKVLYYFASDCQHAKDKVKSYLGDQAYVTNSSLKHTDWNEEESAHLDAWTVSFIIARLHHCLHF